MLGLVENKIWNYKSKLFFRYFFVSVAVLLFCFLNFINVKTASSPASINYQGKILQNDTVVDENLSMSFVIYDSLTGGSPVYTAFGSLGSIATSSISIESGLFSIDFGAGSTNLLDPAIFSNNSELYLEVIVEGEKLSPRKMLNSVPYAFNAKYLDGISATSSIVSNYYIPISDAEGNFNFNSVTSTELVVSSSIYLGSEKINSWNDIFTGRIVSTTQGGTGKDSSSWTGLLKIVAGEWTTTTLDYSELNNLPILATSSWNWAYNTVSTSYSNWNNAFSWGNHASAGYLTSYTETDPIWTAASGNYYTKTYLNSVMVTTTDSKNINDILMYTASGVQWVPTSTLGLLAGGGASLPLADAGQFLVFDGSNWTPTNSFTTTTYVENVLPNMTGGNGNVSLYSLGNSSNRFSEAWFDNMYLGSSTWKFGQDTNGAFNLLDASSATTSLSIDSQGFIGFGVNASSSSKLAILDNSFSPYSSSTGTETITVDGLSSVDFVEWVDMPPMGMILAGDPRNIRVYAYKETVNGKVYSAPTYYLPLGQTTSTPADNKLISWDWDAVSGADGYLVNGYVGSMGGWILYSFTTNTEYNELTEMGLGNIETMNEPSNLNILEWVSDKNGFATGVQRNARVYAYRELNDGNIVYSDPIYYLPLGDTTSTPADGFLINWDWDDAINSDGYLINIYVEGSGWSYYATTTDSTYNEQGVSYYTDGPPAIRPTSIEIEVVNETPESSGVDSLRLVYDSGNFASFKVRNDGLLNINTNGNSSGGIYIDDQGNIGMGTSTINDLLTLSGSVNILNGYLKFDGVAGTAGQILMVNSEGYQEWMNTSSLGFVDTDTTSSPAGSLYEIQFNSSGIFGSNANFVWNEATGRLGVGTSIPTSLLTLGGDLDIGGDGMLKFNGIGGSANQILMINSSNGLPYWTNTSSLGISSGSSLPTGSDGQMMFYGTGGWEATDVIKIRSGNNNIYSNSNFTAGDSAVALGGISNSSTGAYTFVGGGQGNEAFNQESSVIGGRHNTTLGAQSFIGGGEFNTTTAQFSFIGGGGENLASGYASFIGGGYQNRTYGSYSFIGGGSSNVASGSSAVAFGTHMTVSGTRSFGINLYGDVTERVLAQDNTFAVMGGNVGIGTTTPSYPLTVTGNVNITGDYLVNGVSLLSSETDPIWLASSSDYLTINTASSTYLQIIAPSTTLWDEAYSWGNHASAGYLTTSTGLTINNFATNTISQWINDAGYITDGNTNWDNSYGFITSAAISSSTYWDQAYSWGNHASAGYLTSYTETDPIWTAASGNYYTKTYLNSVMVTTTDSKNINDILMYTASGVQWVPTSTLGISGGESTVAAGSAGQIQFNDDGTNFGATSTLVWNNTNGRLGIGTASPSGTLHIYGNSLTIADPTGATGTINYDQAGGWTELGFSHTIRVYAYQEVDGQKYFSNGYSQSLILTDKNINNENFYTITWSWNAVSGADGYLVTVDDPAWTFENGVYVVGTNSFTEYGDGMEYTLDMMETFGGLNPVPKEVPASTSFIVASTGNVGISTSTPNEKLTLSGNLNIINNGLIKFNGNGGSAGQILMVSSTGYQEWVSTSSLGISGGSSSPAGSDGQIQFNNSGSFGASTNLYWNNTFGRLGIGTTSPSYSLTVAGDLAVTGAIRVGNSYSAGTAGYLLMSNGSSSAPSWVSTSTFSLPSGTAGQTLYNNGSNWLATSSFQIVGGSILASGTNGNTPVSGAGTRMMWIPNKGAFRAGIVEGSEWDEANIGKYSTVFGEKNYASATSSFVGGGTYNYTSGIGSFVGGGYYNGVGLSGRYTAIIGGKNNLASASSSFIGGGLNNTITVNSNYTAIVGGEYNTTTYSNDSFIGGGYKNGIYSSGQSFIAGGQLNYIDSGSARSFVLGGYNNNIAINSNYSFIAGGYGNTVSGVYSGAFGRNLTVSGDYSIGFSFDGYVREISQDYTFAILGQKVGIGTTTPSSKLHVEDSNGGDVVKISGKTLNDIISLGFNTSSGFSYLNGDAYGSDRTFKIINSSGYYWAEFGVDGSVGIGQNVAGDGYAINTYNGNVSIDDGSFLVSGTTGDTPVSGAGTRMMWVPSKSAFRAGTVAGTEWNAGNIGLYSTAFGENNTAVGIGSFIAGGELNIVSSTYAFISGYNNQIFSGENSSILGGDSNLINTYYGNNFIIGGWLNTVTGTTIGTSPYYSGIIGGNQNIIGGDMAGNSIIIGGYKNTISGSGSTIISGNNSTMSGDYSTMIGGSMTVSSDYSLGINLSSSGSILNQANTMAIMGGKVGIGTTTPQYALEVKSNTANIARFTGSNSSSCTLSSTGIIACSSDIRLKKNITEITGQLENIMNLNPVLYNWNSQLDSETKNASFIAQELEEVYPNLVMTEDGENAYKSISMVGMIPYIVSAIQEQQIQIDSISMFSTSSESYFTTSTVGNDLNITGDVNFISKVNFDSHIFFNEDQVGKAKIVPGFDEVRIIFENDYTVEPIITVTPVGIHNFSYGVDKIDINGFEIVISEAQDEEVVFNWHSFATDKLKMFISDGTIEVLYDGENILTDAEEIFFENNDSTVDEVIESEEENLSEENNEIIEDIVSSTESNLDGTSSTESNLEEENVEEFIEDSVSSTESNLDGTSSTESNLE
ncbi:MAG: tail fiber domain-containing protein [Patescibacteria group bacterium]